MGTPRYPTHRIPQHIPPLILMSCCGWHQDNVTALFPEVDATPLVPTSTKQALMLPPAPLTPPARSSPPRPSAAAQAGRLFKQKEGSSSCLQPCPHPPTHAGHPALPAPSPPRAEPGAGTVPKGPASPIVPLRVPPQIHTQQQGMQPVVPVLGGSRHGSRGRAEGMLCPARQHGGTQAGERDQEAARSTAPQNLRDKHTRLMAYVGTKLNMVLLIAWRLKQHAVSVKLNLRRRFELRWLFMVIKYRTGSLLSTFAAKGSSEVGCYRPYHAALTSGKPVLNRTATVASHPNPAHRETEPTICCHPVPVTRQSPLLSPS